MKIQRYGDPTTITGNPEAYVFFLTDPEGREIEFACHKEACDFWRLLQAYSRVEQSLELLQDLDTSFLLDSGYDLLYPVRNDLTKIAIRLFGEMGEYGDV